MMASSSAISAEQDSPVPYVSVYAKTGISWESSISLLRSRPTDGILFSFRSASAHSPVVEQVKFSTKVRPAIGEEE